MSAVSTQPNQATDWISVPFGKVARLINGRAYKKSELLDEGTPVLRIQNLNGGDRWYYSNLQLPPDKYCDRDDLLFAWSASFGPYIWDGDKAIYHYHIWKVIPGPRLDKRFAFRLLAFLTRSVKDAAHGVAMLHITKGKMEAWEVALPPLAEQKRIARILDAADALRAKRRESLAQLDTLLQSTFLDMFGDPVTNPMGWEIVNVGHEIGFLTSGSRGWAKYYADSGDTFIRIQNLKDGRLDLGDIAFVNAPESAESKRTKVEPGDVLLSITADLGRTAVVPDRIGKAHINQHLAILRFTELNPVFVSYQLASRGGQAQFARLNREGVKAGLNFNDVKSIRLMKPPLDLQRRFAAIVESVKQQKACQRTHLAELDTLFAALQSRAFRGDL